MQGGFDELMGEPLMDEEESMEKRHGWLPACGDDNHDLHRPIIVQVTTAFA